MSIIKFLKIGLPITTATSATIFTTLLVSEKKNQIIKLENLDNSLNDLKLPDEKFEDEPKFYTKEEKEEPKEVDEATKQKITELLEEVGKLDSEKNLGQKIKKFEQEMEKLFNEKTNKVKSEDSNINPKQNPESSVSNVQTLAEDEKLKQREQAQEDITKSEFSGVISSVVKGDNKAVEYLESQIGGSRNESEDGKKIERPLDNPLSTSESFSQGPQEKLNNNRYCKAQKSTLNILQIMMKAKQFPVTKMN